MNIAIILAAGTGNRMESSTPKQFLEVAGKTVLEHSVEAFEKHSKIDEIAVVLREEDIATFNSFIPINNWHKVKIILKGGEERYQSALAAINAYRQFPDYCLIIHDAARPLISHRIIDDVIEALHLYNAVTVAIPTTDTIYEVDDSQHFVKTIPQRFFLQRAQTPQAFKVKTIQKAYEIALQTPNFQSTDDAGVVAKYLPNEKIYIVRGEEKNLKITYKEDIFLMENYLQHPTEN